MKKIPGKERPILLVDDEQAWLHSFSLTLRAKGLKNIVCCQDSRKVQAILAEQDIGVIVLDLTMPHLAGDELLPILSREHPDIPVIILTGLDLVDTAVNCMKLGAFDYYTKVSEENRLIAGVQRAIKISRLKQENSLLKNHFLEDTLDHPEVFAGIITHNKAMRSIFQYMESIAFTDEPVLISGETGVGKELIARAVHTLSDRKGEFVPVNIAGLDDTMLADTMFGHKKGAFTGADRARAGLIEQAGNGTLFLDEIGDLSQTSQIKLLRLLQEQEYFPLGSDIAKRTNCRMVFATHRDLDGLQNEGSFRKDLYYRLHAHRIHIPPLRERFDDLPILVDFFLEHAAQKLAKNKPAYPKELIDLLGTYDFPGNIRELKNMIFDAVSKHKSKTLSMESFKNYIHHKRPHLDGVINTPQDAVTPFAALASLPTLKEAGFLLIQEALNRANGNQAIAAELLGITRQALNWRLKQCNKTD
ncbi:MAG: sigma-54 dependent transcriptional regulator [Desulfobulbaceae bacterium]|nr:sigma-54 dependent transcriptional regulator [Desulfobulbaceae bacterium]HIJ77986.1 sigma-54-dependent Fis family transcriptional regulator [Deltaproteobacteria bacterium]